MTIRKQISSAGEKKIAVGVVTGKEHQIEFNMEFLQVGPEIKNILGAGREPGQENAESVDGFIG